MIKLQKEKNRDFKILNISDPQMTVNDWKSPVAKGIIVDLMDYLLSEDRPDLITVSGDIDYAEDEGGHCKFADFIDGFGIPWAIVWGNHDNQSGNEFIEKHLAYCFKCKNFLYERGDEAFGNGNYVIGIYEEEKPVSALFMIDSHDREDFTNGNGETFKAWARLPKNQQLWIKDEAKRIQGMGFYDSAMILHIPIYAYNDAFNAAFSGICEAGNVPPSESNLPQYWNEGYKDSFGIKREGICSYPIEDGAFDIIKSTGIIRHVIAGHDHVNNFSINYQGVRLTYSLKCGIGCYSDRDLLGGTYLTIGPNGISGIYHRYFDASKYDGM